MEEELGESRIVLTDAILRLGSRRWQSDSNNNIVGGWTFPFRPPWRQ